MSDMTIEQRLALNHYDVDTEAHIKIKPDVCRECDLRPCLYVCPAECFKFKEGKISFSYEGCLECGSCRITCDREAIEWSYPRAGFGISYEYG
jgi:ferredoxin like protein